MGFDPRAGTINPDYAKYVPGGGANAPGNRQMTPEEYAATHPTMRVGSPSSYAGVGRWGQQQGMAGPNTGNRGNTSATSGSASGTVGGGGAGTTAGFNWDVAANPYQKQVYDKYNDLFNRLQAQMDQSKNAEPGLQQMRREQDWALKNLQAKQGARGFGQAGLGAQQDIMNTFGQQQNKFAADWQNSALDRQQSLLRDWAGALSGQGGQANSIAGAQLGLFNASNDATRTMADYNARMAELPWRILQTQTSAIGNLAQFL